MAPRFNPSWHYHTRMVIAGERQPPQPGAPTSTPLYSSTTYFHQNLADFDAALAGTGYAYGRNGNPTNNALEIATATAATVATSDDRLGSDVLTISRTAVFADKNVGTGKTVSVSGVSLAGTDASNYTVAGTGSATASKNQIL